MHALNSPNEWRVSNMDLAMAEFHRGATDRERERNKKQKKQTGEGRTK